MDLKRFEEQIFFSTVRITIPRKSGGGTSIGTGFIFLAPLNDPKTRSVILLVSNKHVYVDPTQSIILNFTRRDPDNKEGPLLGQTTTLQAGEFHGVYTEHPDPEIDLACLNVSVITHPKRGIYYRNLYPKMLADYNEPDLLPGTEVWFVGYPENRYDTTHNLPLLRRGYIASVPKIDFNGKKQLVIDAQVFPGSSGSPVFASLGDKFKLIGIVTETMIRHEQLQSVHTGVGIGVQQVLGLGIVLKSALVKELVDAATTKIRAQLAEAEPEPVIEVSEPLAGKATQP